MTYLICPSMIQSGSAIIFFLKNAYSKEIIILLFLNNFFNYWTVQNQMNHLKHLESEALNAHTFFSFKNFLNFPGFINLALILSPIHYQKQVKVESKSVFIYEP